MFLLELCFALSIGLAIAWSWSSAFDTHGPWNSFFWFFFVIFLFSWGGGTWMQPFGPTGWGVAWLPIFFMGIFMALLLTAATPQASRRRSPRGVPAAAELNGAEQAAAERRIEVTLDRFFWAFVFVLAIFALSGGLWRDRLF